MPRYRLLAIDIDGTLLNSRDELTGPTRDALVRAGRAGIRVVLATGRRYSRTLHLAEPLAIEVPLVCASGALTKDAKDHRTFHRAVFDGQVLRDALAIIDQCGYEPILCADTFAEGFDFYQAPSSTSDASGPGPGANPELAEYLRLNPGDGRTWPELIARPPAGVFCGFAMGTKPAMRALEAELHRQMPERLTTSVLRSPRYVGFMCEFAPAGTTKWSAVRRLADGWGIGGSEICAVGDDVNDVPMIREAGLGVAMGNARPEVLAAADRIAPAHDADGLVEVVRWLME